MYSIPPKAETQGSTERIIGTWLKSRGGRERIVIASKVSGRSVERLASPRRQARSARRDQHPLCRRAEPEAPADRLYRSLPAALARPCGEPVRRRRQRVPRPAEARRLDPDRRDARRSRRVSSRRARSATSASPTRRAWGTMRFLHAAETGRWAARRLDPEQLQPLNRNYELGLAEIGDARGCGASRLFAAGPGLSHRQVPGRRAAGRRPYDAVQPRHALREAGRRDRHRGLSRSSPASSA